MGAKNSIRFADDTPPDDMYMPHPPPPTLPLKGRENSFMRKALMPLFRFGIRY
jgi:hypothetical protein